MSQGVDQDQASDPHYPANNGHGQKVSPDEQSFDPDQSDRGTGGNHVVYTYHIPHGSPNVLDAHCKNGGDPQLIGNGKLEHGEEHVGYSIGSCHERAQCPDKGIDQWPGALEDPGHGSGHDYRHPLDPVRVVP